MPNGILIVDKPLDWTSHDVVAKLRGLLRERRIGHGGTLDPMATGVLPVFVGRATRAVEFVAQGEKEYVAGLRLGITTDTQDTTGTLLQTRPVTLSAEGLSALLDSFQGDLLQVPPMFSAIKIQGKKLYELARKGKEVERPPRPVTIHSLTLEGQERPTDFLLRVRCSKGTYIRTLCHDIGAACGCGGAMYALRRTMAAGFTLSDCVTLDEVADAAHAGRAEQLLVPVHSCFSAYPAFSCTAAQRDRFVRNGAPFPCDAPPGTYRVFGPEKDFLMVGRAENGRMETVKSFFSPK